VKCYRAELADRTFPRLEDYRRDFIRFLKTSRRMFTPKLQRESVQAAIVGFFAHLRKRFEDSFTEACQKGNQLTESQLKRIFTDLVRDELERTRQWPLLDEMAPRRMRDLRQKYARRIGEVRIGVFEKLPISQLTAKRLLDAAVEVLTRRRLLQSGVNAGVVIAGFGEKEHFPKLIRMQVLGVAVNLPLYFIEDTVSIEAGREAVVVPLAQREMVETFMEGVDPKLKETIETSTRMLFQRMSDTIIDEVRLKHPKEAKQLRKKVSAGLDALLPSLYSEWTEFRRKAYTDPVMQMVASLPKDELTRFKRRISNEQETVGGPIDVAVITKGDGFVWTKRKHYFPPELNPRYMARTQGKWSVR
jgi:hypothetical protein